MSLSRRADDVIDELAAQQHGIVSRAQLAAAGVSAGSIDRRVCMRRMHVIHRGVYQVGPVRSARCREMAATLACGDAAHLSHWSAAAFRGLVAPPPPSSGVHVLTPPERRVRVPGIIAHRVRLAPEDGERVEGIPVTSVPRTILDLACTVRMADLEQVVALAERERLASAADLERILASHGRHRGAARLRALLDADTPPAFTRSEAEARFLRLIRRARIRHPQVNAPFGRYELDFFWPVERLAVEVDGHAWHGSARAFRRDRRRDFVIEAAGVHVLRLSWQQIVDEPEATAVLLSRVLDERRASRHTTVPRTPPNTLV
jgi:very-short-patch-repair endonuclease